MTTCVRRASDGHRAGVEDSGLALAAFALGTVGNLLKGVPQFVRTGVRGRVAGLAPGAVWLAALANVLWLCFGIAISDARFTALSALGTALTTVTLVRYVGSTPRALHRWWAPPAAAAAAVFTALAVAEQGRVLAVAGVAMGVAISLPQLVHLWRVRGAPADVSGVSQLDIAVVVAAQVGWTTYWVTQGQPVVAAGAAYGLLTRAATLVLLRAHLTRGHPSARRFPRRTSPSRRRPATTRSRAPARGRAARGTGRCR